MVPTFQWNMPFHVLRAVFLSFNPTRSETAVARIHLETPIIEYAPGDFTANLITEVCNDVCVEPNLQPITGEVLSHATAISDDGARLDITVGWWKTTFFTKLPLTLWVFLM